MRGVMSVILNEFSQGGAGVFPLRIKTQIQLKHVSIIISKLKFIICYEIE